MSFHRRIAVALLVCGCAAWPALALGDNKKGGVGWGADRADAEKNALASCNQNTANGKVVFSINAREMRVWGAIAYSPSTGKWGYATGGGRFLQQRAIDQSK